MKWISCKDKLPEEGKYVIGYYTGGNHIDRSDPIKVNYKIVSIRKGISREEREKLNPDDRRRITYESGDQDGNNRVPYHWETFGPASYFGQEISHWHPLPEALECFGSLFEEIGLD